MKCMFLAFCVLLSLNGSVHTYKASSSMSNGRSFRKRVLGALEEQDGHVADLNNEVTGLTDRVVKLEAYVDMLLQTVVMCESGFIASEKCDPPSRECFSQTKTAKFTLDFAEPPAFSAAFYHIDVVNTAPIKVEAPPSVTQTEISILFRCFDFGLCAQGVVSWMACGPVVMPYDGR